MGNASSSDELPPQLPPVHNVPHNAVQILDFSSGNTPEAQLKDALLSDDRSTKTIVTFGLGGTGKTTILRALAFRHDVCAQFADAIYFVQLGQDATVESLASQLKLLIASLTDENFASTFAENVVKPATQATVLADAVRRLAKRRLLLIVDDVWESNTATYLLVKRLATEVQNCRGVGMKLLSSSRDRSTSRKPFHARAVELKPRAWDDAISSAILCYHAGVTEDDIRTLHRDAKNALRDILQGCAGLPLTLAVAGSGVAVEMEAIGQHAWRKYFKAMQRNMSVVGNEPTHLHGPLFDAIRTTLGVFDAKWSSQVISVQQAFSSLSIVQKAAWVPDHVLQKLWNVSEAEVYPLVRVFADGSIVNRVEKDSKSGVTIHDLVIDFSLQEAQDGDVKPRTWHRELVAAYATTVPHEACLDCSSLNAPCFWLLDLPRDGYTAENIIRHMACGGDIIGAIRLSADARWICQTYHRTDAFFQRNIIDLQLLARHGAALCVQETHVLGKDGVKAVKLLLRQVDILQDTLEMSMAARPAGVDELAFQLLGRLRALQDGNPLLQYCVFSIEHCLKLETPQAAVRPGVLRGAHFALKRELKTPFAISAASLGPGVDEIVIGGPDGQLAILDKRSGAVLDEFAAHEKKVTGLVVDRGNHNIISSSEDGTVRMWKGCSLQSTCVPFRWHFQREISAIGLGRKNKLLACASKGGRLRLLDVTNSEYGSQWTGHGDTISVMDTSDAGDAMVTGCYDGSVLRWACGDVTEMPSKSKLLPVERGRGSMRCVAISGDGSVWASAEWATSRVYLWREGGGAEPTILDEEVMDMVLTEDGRTAFCACRNGGVRTFEVTDDGRVSWRARINPGNRYDMLLYDEKGDEMFACSCINRKIGVMRTEWAESETLFASSWKQGVQHFAVSNDGETVAVWDRRNRFRFYSGRGESATLIDGPKFHLEAGREVDAMTISNDRSLVLICARRKVYCARPGVVEEVLLDDPDIVAAIENAFPGRTKAMLEDKLLSYIGCFDICDVLLSRESEDVTLLLNVRMVGNPWIYATWTVGTKALKMVVPLNKPESGFNIYHSWVQVNRGHKETDYVFLEQVEGLETQEKSE